MELLLLLDLHAVDRSQVLAWDCEDSIDVLLLQVVLGDIHLVLSLEVLFLQLLVGFRMLEELDHLH